MMGTTPGGPARTAGVNRGSVQMARRTPRRSGAGRRADRHADQTAGAQPGAAARQADDEERRMVRTREARSPPAAAARLAGVVRRALARRPARAAPRWPAEQWRGRRLKKSARQEPQMATRCPSARWCPAGLAADEARWAPGDRAVHAMANACASCCEAAAMWRASRTTERARARDQERRLRRRARAALGRVCREAPRRACGRWWRAERRRARPVPWGPACQTAFGTLAAWAAREDRRHRPQMTCAHGTRARRGRQSTRRVRTRPAGPASTSITSPGRRRAVEVA